MSKLNDFNITKRWPAKKSDFIQLYSLPTPNGVKASIMLEETGLDYEPHLVDFGQNDQTSPEFLSLNPNNKIPAIIDPNGPDASPLALWESGAILVYLAEKTGQFLSAEPHKRYHTLQWLMFQMGGIGPMIGQLGFFHTFAGKDISDPRPKQRYADESDRLLKVLDAQLSDQDWVVGEYSIADIAIAPWLRAFRDFYDATPLVDWKSLKNIPSYIDRFTDRPAVQKGLKIPARE